MWNRVTSSSLWCFSQAVEVGQTMLAVGVLVVVFGEDDGSFDEQEDTLYRFQVSYSRNFQVKSTNHISDYQ